MYAAFKLLQQEKLVRKLLVIAPLRPCYLVWPQEQEKWEDFKKLRVVVLHGNDKDDLLDTSADVFCVNPDGLPWLMKSGFLRKLKPDVLCVDESSQFKRTTTRRFKLLEPLLNTFTRRWTLTGTPSSNGYLDVFGQAYITDHGNALGHYITAYRNRYFDVSGKGGFDWVLREGADKEIQKRLKPIVCRVDIGDFVKVPTIVSNDIYVDLPPKIRELYDKLESEMFAVLEKTGRTITALSAAAAMSKCIAEGTLVLTDNGWKAVETLNNIDNLWDGVEFVSAARLVYTGFKPVVECFGVRMTPEHKVLTKSGWHTAQEVLDGESAKGYVRAGVRLPYGGGKGREQSNRRHFGARTLETALCMWKRGGYVRGVLTATRKRADSILWLPTLCYFGGGARYARHDEHQTISHLDGHAGQMPEPAQQRLGKLWWAWNQGVSTVADIWGLLAGHARRLLGRPDARSEESECGVPQNELPLGNAERVESESARLGIYQHPKRPDDDWRSSRSIRHEVHNAVRACGDPALEPERLLQTCGQAHVYDIVDAGPRQRFVVLGRDGVPLIVHNCSQIASGGIYVDPLEDDKGLLRILRAVRETAQLHDAKTDALENLHEELGYKPLLVAYDYHHDLARLRKRFGADVPVLGGAGGGKRGMLHDKELEKKWNQGEIPLMFGHPMSIGHGLNLQEAGNDVCWYSLTYDLELYIQFNKRVARQGNKHSVCRVHHLLARATTDEAKLATLRRKDASQRALLDALRDYAEYRGHPLPILNAPTTKKRGMPHGS